MLLICIIVNKVMTRYLEKYGFVELELVCMLSFVQ